MAVFQSADIETLKWKSVHCLFYKFIFFILGSFDKNKKIIIKQKKNKFCLGYILYVFFKFGEHLKCLAEWLSEIWLNMKLMYFYKIIAYGNVSLM